MDELLRTLVISDLHVPYHDESAVELALRVVDAWHPDQIIVNGDLIDAYSVSKYDKDPERLMDGGLQEEADAARRILRRFNASLQYRTRIKTLLPKRRIIVKPGNHENRVMLYLRRHPELHGVRALRIPDLLGLDAEGIEYQDAPTILANGALRVSHGTRVRQKAGYTATAELEKAMHRFGGITGHTHRIGTVYAATDNEIISWSEGGCLCDLNPGYIDGQPNWQQGITLVYSSLTTREYHVQSVPFVGGACVIEGKRITT
jgi:predicted phosphodiesterase